MNRVFQIVALTPVFLALLIGSLGCEQGGAGRVAVIDLNRVASATGHGKQMREADIAFKTKLDNDFKAAQKQASDQIKAKEKEFGDKPTEKQKAELSKMRNGLRLGTMRGPQALNQQAQMNQMQMWSQFRQIVKDFSQVAASELGLTIVLISSRNNNDPILHFDASVDITDQVIQSMLVNAQNPTGPNTGAGAGTGPGALPGPGPGALGIPPKQTPAPQPGKTGKAGSTDKPGTPKAPAKTPESDPASQPAKDAPKTDAKPAPDAGAKTDPKTDAPKTDAPKPDAPTTDDAKAPIESKPDAPTSDEK
jgi:Skp family chaperone for outer membrane proteins